MRSLERLLQFLGHVKIHSKPTMRENRFIVLVFSVVPPLASLAPERQKDRGISKACFIYKYQFASLNFELSYNERTLDAKSYSNTDDTSDQKPKSAHK